MTAIERGEPSPPDLRGDLQLARAVGSELLKTHRLTDPTYEAIRTWGPAGTVELLTLVGCFAMVCLTMNVARTPSRRTTAAVRALETSPRRLAHRQTGRNGAMMGERVEKTRLGERFVR